MDRREFIQRSSMAAAVASIARGGRGADARVSPSPAERAAVAVARGTDYGARLKAAVRAARGPIATSGETVVIKPTLAFNRAPWEGANVHPDVLRAAIELALDAGAREVRLFDRTSVRADLAYRVSHADRAVKAISDSRVRLLCLSERDFVPFARDRSGKSIDLPRGCRVCRHVLDADRIINVATLRHHPTRKASLAMANLLGVIGGWPFDSAGNRDAELALVSLAVRPELTVLDATRVIVRNGPAGRDAVDVQRWNTIVVSRDPVAVETYGARLFQIDPHSLGHIQIAASLGLGCMDLGGHRIETV